jgi:hypothetical protein
MVIVAVLLLPAPSNAFTVITFAPEASAIGPAVQVLVPLAVPPPPRLLLHVTLVTATLSAALPLMVTVRASVAVFAPPNVLIVTLGASLSGRAVTEKAALVPLVPFTVLPAPLAVARIVTPDSAVL